MPTASAPLWLRAAPAIFLLLWSTGVPVAKLGVASAEPMTFLALRYAIVLAILGALYLALRPPLPRRRAVWRHLAVVGLVIQFGYFGLTYVSVDRGMSAGGLALILSLQPICVAVLAPYLARERVDAWRWLGLILGLAGAVLVIVARSAIDASSAASVACAAGALAAIVAGTLYEKRHMAAPASDPGAGAHPILANLVQYAAGLAPTLALALLFERMTIDWNPAFAGALAYLVIANSLVAITLYLAMIRSGEVARVSALFFLMPPVAAIAAWILLGEPIPPLAWLGMALAGIGVALAGALGDWLRRGQRSP
jgi:drug/metabolite transporter (DMT)-like permease